MKFSIGSFLLLGNLVSSFAESSSLDLATDGQEQENYAVMRSGRTRRPKRRPPKDRPRPEIGISNPFLKTSCQKLIDSLPPNRKRQATDELRFNKIAFVERDDLYAMLPLTSKDYPVDMHEYVLNTLQDFSTCPSVVAESDVEIKYNMTDVREAIGVGGGPEHPSNNKDATFWDTLRVVMDVNDERRANADVTTVLPHLPFRWSGFTIHEAAEAVRAEFPGYHQMLMLKDILDGKYGPVKMDTNVVPIRSKSEFLRKQVLLAELNTWAISMVGPHNFCAKYYGGRARPEEVVWAIKTDQIADGVPDDIVCRAKQLDINSANEFTAYKEGAPRHPSWPAMHSAASSASFWLRIVLDINDAQWCEAKKVDYAVAFGRTIAGVHYEDDNFAGLKMGQELVARELPEFLSLKYGDGVDKAKIMRKVEQMRFNWDDFDPNDPCPE